MVRKGDNIYAVQVKQTMVVRGKTKNYYSAHNLATRATCQYTTAIMAENLSPNICGLRAVLPMKVEVGAQAMAVDRKTKSTNNSTNQGEFLHNYYTFQSVHDGEYDGAVRTFVTLSSEL